MQRSEARPSRWRWLMRSGVTEDRLAVAHVYRSLSRPTAHGWLKDCNDNRRDNPKV